MINITLKCQKKNICENIYNFQHYVTWFLAPLSVFTTLCLGGFSYIT